MATWPGYSAGLSVTPASTIRWGTGNTMASAIVVSIDEHEKVDPIYIEQGDGVEATRFLVKHGKVWDITVIDSGAAFNSPPTVGSTVSLPDLCTGTGTGNTMTVTSLTAMVIDNNYKAARKVEGQRTIRVEYINLADGGTGPTV